jgi:hypothetical protein
VFTPGDNDWVDCDRTAGYNSLKQLGLERQLFFSTPFTLGQHRLREEVQQAPLCLSTATSSGTAPCVENRRWTVSGVTLRDTEHPGLVQQPLRRRPRRRRVRGSRRRRYRLDATDLR